MFKVLVLGLLLFKKDARFDTNLSRRIRLSLLLTAFCIKSGMLAAAAYMSAVN